MGIFNNPWIVGIGVSVISGIIVWLVTTKVLTRRVNKEYLRKIDQANSEILYALRPSIAAGNFPSLEIISSIISATVKKYELLEKEVVGTHEISDLLIKEIMDNPFLPPDQKEKFCGELLNFKKPKSKPKETNKQSSPAYGKLRENFYISILTITMGVFTALASFSISLPTISNKFDSTLISLLLLPLSAILVTLFAYVYIKYSKQRRVINKIKELLSEVKTNDINSNTK